MKDSRQDVVNFWFNETDPVLWFQVNPDFDNHIRERFSSLYDMARDGLCDTWRNDADGCLALCLVLGQFPRNMFRGTARAYATDDRALLTAKQAIARGFDQVLPPAKKRMIYLPFLYSEKLPDQRKAVDLFFKLRRDDPTGYEKALRYKDIIERFGRFPDRNRFLNRSNTPDEQEYLAGGGGEA